MNDSYRFSIKSEGQEYLFDIVAKKESAHTIFVGGKQYAIEVEDPLHLDAIEFFLQQVNASEIASIDMLKQNLSQIPSIQEIQIKTTKKTYDVGVSHLESASSQSSSSIVVGEKAKMMDTRLEGFLSERGFEGVVLVIDNDKTILQKGYGQSFAMDTHFPIGSLTKPITAMAILDLFKNRDPQEVRIVDVLPEECLPSDPALRSSWETVTLLDLLNHTSGLPPFEELGKKIMELKGGDIHQVAEPNQVISLVLHHNLQGGSDYMYSNFGYHLLGKIIEQVSQKPYSQYMDQYFSTMGLEHSRYVNKNETYPPVMSWDGKKNVEVDSSRLDPPEEAYSSGGLHSTIGDLEKLLAQIKTPQTLSKAGHAKEKEYDFRQEYLCHAGWNYSDVSGKQEIWKNGAVGGFGSLLVSYPETKSAIIILSNQPTDVERYIGRDLSDILNAESAKAAEMKLADRASHMGLENKTKFLEEKNAVARAYWKEYIDTKSDKEHGGLKRFLASCFADPLYIQREFDGAVSEHNFERFLSIFSLLSIEQIGQIDAGENLNVLPRSYTSPQSLALNELSDRLIQIEQNITTVNPQNPTIPSTVSLEALMKQYGVPGASIAIFDHGVVCHKGYGALQNEQVLIQAASTSKMVTALVVLSLVKEGVLSLDDNINIILKDYWESIDENKLTDVEHPVSVRNLLSHTAGTTISGFHGRPKGTELSTDEIIKEVKIAKTPDKDRFEYSGGGTMLLQKIIELKCKKPFADVVKEKVFIPLGMQHSTYSPSKDAQTAQGFGPDGSMVPGGYFAYPEHAAAGLWSTPAELAKVAMEIQKAYEGQESIITQDLAKEMLTAQSVDSPNGLGVFVDKLSRSVVFHHPGANAGFKCVLIANNNGQGACIMTNSEHGQELWKDVVRTIAQECKWPNAGFLPMCRPICTPQEVEPVENKADWSEKYAGFYSYEDDRSERHTIEVTSQYLREEGYQSYQITHLGKGICLFQEFTPGPPQKFYFTEDVSGKIILHVFDHQFFQSKPA